MVPIMPMDDVVSQTVDVIFSSLEHRKINMHTEKFFRNLIESNGNQIVFTFFRLIRHQTDVRLVTNQPENGKYNLISV